MFQMKVYISCLMIFYISSFCIKTTKLESSHDTLYLSDKDLDGYRIFDPYEGELYLKDDSFNFAGILVLKFSSYMYEQLNSNIPTKVYFEGTLVSLDFPSDSLRVFDYVFLGELFWSLAGGYKSRIHELIHNPDWNCDEISAYIYYYNLFMKNSYRSFVIQNLLEKIIGSTVKVYADTNDSYLVLIPLNSFRASIWEYTKDDIRLTFLLPHNDVIPSDLNEYKTKTLKKFEQERNAIFERVSIIK